jgi:hypothetical protein
MAEEVKVEKQEEDWMTKKWRPMMAMMYMLCCLCDFAIFPIMFTIVQFWEVQAANDAFRQWVPITLQGGGLFHVAMGGVLGVSAYGRTQEKLGGATTPSVPTPTLTTATPVVTAPVATPDPAPTYSTPVVAAAPAPGPVVAGFGGKAAPPAAPQPLI